MTKEILIVIPARYGSTRFPGKPLAKIAGKEMLLRVWENANKAIQGLDQAQVIVATEDEKICTFCTQKNMQVMLTSAHCKTGTDRVCEVVNNRQTSPDFVINLQGDNPMCPPWFVRDMIGAFLQDPTIQVITPVVRLSWVQLDELRENKKTTPFSGTTAVIDADHNALWFSKNIIPALRKEKDLRLAGDMSPVFRHIGLYGYSVKALKTFTQTPESVYEKLEGLEQLRFLENHIPVKTVIVDYKGYGSMSGIDSPEDIVRAETLFAKQGEF